jgi:hypothetical protein
MFFLRTEPCRQIFIQGFSDDPNPIEIGLAIHARAFSGLAVLENALRVSCTELCGDFSALFPSLRPG